MSYILDALKKSEQERQIGHVPDISMVHQRPPQVASPWRRWLIAALVLNALILALIAWRPWTAGGARGGNTQPDNAAANSVVESAVEPRPVRSDDRPGPAADPGLSPLASLPEPVSEMPSPAPPPAPSFLAEEPEPHVSSPVPHWEDLPADVRSGLPMPRIDVHVFAREPARRFVLVNLRKHQEGDALEEGPTIEAILADGVVLSYGGQRYRVGRP